MLSAKRKARTSHNDVHDPEDDDRDRVKRGVGRGGGNQILPVATLPVDFDGVPIDGAQYLAVVRRQANAIPIVVRSLAHADGGEADHSPEASNAVSVGQRDGASSIPSQEWRSLFLGKFENMRESLTNRDVPDGGAQLGLPQVSNPRKWFRFIYGCEPDGEGTKTTEDTLSEIRPEDACADRSDKFRQPGLHLLRHFYTSQILALLCAFDLWTQEGWRAKGEQDRYGQRYALLPFESRWIFALLSHLDERLVGDDISALRSLARSCIAQVKRVREVQSRQSAPNCADDGELGAWIVVCAIVGIWRQNDLWDDARAMLREESNGPTRVA